MVIIQIRFILPNFYHTVYSDYKFFPFKNILHIISSSSVRLCYISTNTSWNDVRFRYPPHCGLLDVGSAPPAFDQSGRETSNSKFEPPRCFFELFLWTTREASDSWHLNPQQVEPWYLRARGIFTLKKWEAGCFQMCCSGPHTVHNS